MEKYPHPYWKHFRHVAFIRAVAFSSGRLHGYVCRLSIRQHGVGLRAPPQEWSRRSILVESTLVDGKAANTAMQPVLTEGHIPTEGPMPKMLPVGVVVLFNFLDFALY